MRNGWIQRLHKAVATVMLVVAGGFFAAPLLAQSPPESERISFQIATGPVSGDYFKVGEALASIISHPPGLARCDKPGVCGPLGLIATTRSSSGSVWNAGAVDGGRTQAALIQADVLDAAYNGEGPFADTAGLNNLRAVARLHDETMHLIVSSRSRIKRIKDLTGKRVGIDRTNSGTDWTVRAILSAGRVQSAKVRMREVDPAQAGEDLRAGRLDAFFMLGVAPLRDIDKLTRRGQVRVLSIDNSIVQRMTRKSQLYVKSNLAAGVYRGSKAIVSVGVPSILTVHRSQPQNEVFKIVQALWNPANRTELLRLGRTARSINARRAGQDIPVPLHSGAEKFYANIQR